MLSPKSFSGCEPRLDASPRGHSVNFSENEAGTFLNSIPRTLVLAKNLSGMKGGWGLGSKTSGWFSPPHLTAEASGATLRQCLKEQPRLLAAACCMLGGPSTSPACPLHVWSGAGTAQRRSLACPSNPFFSLSGLTAFSGPRESLAS